MKYTSFVFTLILLLGILQSCKKEDDKIVAPPKVYQQVEKVKWFLGDWDNTINDAHFKETWKQKNDSTLTAKSFITVKTDTVFYEEIDLLQRNDSLFYIVSVKEQNNEKPVSFYMTASSDKEVTFENPKHDFPTKITYTKITNDRLIAIVSGIKDGKQIKDEFPMKRTQK